MANGTKVKTKVGNLKYVFITGEGKNNALPGAEPRFQYVASIVTEKDSDLHKDFKEKVDAEWQRYKKEFGVKGLPKTNGIKPELKEDPSGKIDPTTEKVAKVETGNVLITFKTNTKWPDGNPQMVKVFDKKGADITKAFHAEGIGIGEGSRGVIHGSAVGNNVGGTHKVTLYLSGIQLSKLVKYVPGGIETEEIEGEDIELDNGMAALSDDEDKV